MKYTVTLMVQKEIDVPDVEGENEDDIAEKEDEAANEQVAAFIQALEKDGWQASIENVEPVGVDEDDDEDLEEEEEEEEEEEDDDDEEE